MNKQAFISGQYFQIVRDSNVYQLEGTDMKDLSICQYYVTPEGEFICKSHVCNVEFVGTKKFKGYTYVMGKRVNCVFDYSDLIPVTPKINH